MEKLVKQIMNSFQGSKSWQWPKNWVLKLVSLFFALFLWYFVVGEDKVDMTVYIPIEIVNLPRDLVISNDFKKQVEVTVSGPRGLIRGIAGQHITRPVDLSEATPGTVVVRNETTSIPFPRGIQVLRIQPTHLIFLLDRLIQKELAVKPTILGDPPSGYELASVLLEPSSITITGPQAILGDEEELTTTPIDISSLTGPTIKQVTLNLKPAIADLIGEPVVTARINVAEKTAEKRVSHIPIQIQDKGAAGQYRVEPQEVTVKAAMPQGLIRATEDLKTLFLANIKVANLGVGQHEVKVSVVPSREVKVLEVTPSTVKVTVSEPNRDEPATKADPSSAPRP